MRRCRTILLRMLLAACAATFLPAWAAADEGAAEAAKAWAAAVMARDVDAQMDLLPATMFPKSGERERQRKLKLHDKEMAIINNQKFLSFEVRAARRLSRSTRPSRSCCPIDRS